LIHKLKFKIQIYETIKPIQNHYFCGMKFLFAFVALLFLALLSCKDVPKNSKAERKVSLETLLRNYPDSLELIIRHGNQAISKMDYASAMADGAKAFRMDSTRLDCRLLYAEALINKSNRLVADIFNAQRNYLIIIKKDTKNPKALVGLANVYCILEDYDSAFKFINKALKINPRFRDAYILKGSIYRLLGNFKLAVSSYETAVQQDPEFYQGYIMLGALYEWKQDPLCIEYYTTAYQLQPKNTDVIYSLAYGKQMFGKENSAKKLYRKMIHLDSLYYVAYFQIGYIKQFSENDLDSALFYYNKTVEINKKHFESYHNIGLIYEDKKDITNALFSYAKALKHNPEFSLSLERVAVLKKKL
jgi:tetratricopeptide (TPR) repeat protein